MTHGARFQDRKVALGMMTEHDNDVSQPMMPQGIELVLKPGPTININQPLGHSCPRGLSCSKDDDRVPFHQCFP